MTFDEFCQQHGVTAQERRDLALILLAMRLRQFIQAIG